MTRNHMTKGDISEEIKKVKIAEKGITKDSFDKLKILCAGLKSEKEVSLLQKSTDETLNFRTICCAKNAISNLFEGDYLNAWYEITDMLDYKKDDEYLSCDEVAIMSMVVELFVSRLESERK